MNKKILKIAGIILGVIILGMIVNFAYGRITGRSASEDIKKIAATTDTTMSEEIVALKAEIEGLKKEMVASPTPTEEEEEVTLAEPPAIADALVALEDRLSAKIAQMGEKVKKAEERAIEAVSEAEEAAFAKDNAERSRRRVERMFADSKGTIPDEPVERWSVNLTTGKALNINHEDQSADWVLKSPTDANIIFPTYPGTSLIKVNKGGEGMPKLTPPEGMVLVQLGKEEKYRNVLPPQYRDSFLKADFWYAVPETAAKKVAE